MGRERATAALVFGVLAAALVAVVPDSPRRDVAVLRKPQRALPVAVARPAPARAPITFATLLGSPRPVPAPEGVNRALATSAPAARIQALPADDLQKTLDRWMAGQQGIDGVVVGVARAGAAPEVWVGAADGPAEGTAVGADDSYGVLSITKTFTEALVLREVAVGRIDLDAPMPAIPGVVSPAPEVVITPRMLLQHSSGLVNYMEAVGYDPAAPITPQKIVSLSLGSPLFAPPGTAASYSNTNFHWLGLLLEHVTGRTYAELVAGLAADFGLHATALDPAGRPGWVGFASGGIRSTVGDIARWGAALFTSGRVLQQGQLALLTTVGGLGVSHGLWPVCTCPGDPGAAAASGLSQIVAHGGLLFYPGERAVVIVHFDKPHAGSSERTYAVGAAMRAVLANAFGGRG